MADKPEKKSKEAAAATSKGIVGMMEAAAGAAKKGQVLLDWSAELAGNLESLRPGLDSVGEGAKLLGEEMFRLQRKNIDIGVTLQESKEQLIALQQTYNHAVTPAFDKNREAIADRMLALKKLQIAEGDIMGYYNLSTTALGKNQQQIIRSQRVMNKFSAQTLQPQKLVWADYNKGIGEFMDLLDSDEMDRQFMIFQVRARRMGMSVSELTGVMKKFDVMDSAQEQGAKLNAVFSALGGNFDGVKASMMDWPDRLEYMSKKLKNIAPTIRAMGPRAGRMMMQQIATTMGISGTMVRKLMAGRLGPEDLVKGEAGLMAGQLPAAMGASEERRRMQLQAMSGVKSPTGRAWRTGREAALGVAAGAVTRRLGGTGVGAAVAAGGQVGVGINVAAQQLVNLFEAKVETDSVKLAAALATAISTSKLDTHLGALAGRVKTILDLYQDGIVKIHEELNKRGP